MSTDPRFIDEEHRASLADARQQFPNAGVEIDEDDPLAALLRTLVSQLHRLDSEIDQIYDERFIDSATGRELELLGANVGVEPRTNESDESLRARVRAGYRIAISDGTFEAVGRAALALLDAAPDDVRLRGPPTTDGGVGQAIVPGALIDASPLTRAEIADELSRAVPLGHRMEVVREEGFQFDSDGQASGEGFGQGAWTG